MATLERRDAPRGGRALADARDVDFTRVAEEAPDVAVDERHERLGHLVVGPREIARLLRTQDLRGDR